MKSDPEEIKRCRRSAMQLLEYKSRTERELLQKLRLKGFSEEAADDAAEYVKSFGYVNDRRYAEVYILNCQQGKSRQKILQELMQKGIDRHTAEEAWEKVSGESRDEKEILRDQMEKKLASLSCVDEKAVRRLYGWFARRGFSHDDIMSVMNELLK